MNVISRDAEESAAPPAQAADPEREQRDHNGQPSHVQWTVFFSALTTSR